MSEPYWHYGGELLRQQCNPDDIVGNFVAVVGSLEPKPRRTSPMPFGMFGPSYATDDVQDDEFVLISCQPNRPAMAKAISLPFVVVDDGVDGNRVLDLRKLVLRIVDRDFAAAWLGVSDIDEYLKKRQVELIHNDPTYKKTREDALREGVCHRCGQKVVERRVGDGKWEQRCPYCDDASAGGIKLNIR